MSRKITSIYFSPGGTTAGIAKLIASKISDTVEEIDLISERVKDEKRFASDDILVVALPVFAGRIPSVCADMLRNLKGDNTPGIAVVSYGNRAYDDALLELVDILEDNGFKIAGAGAVIARHSIFPEVAKGRPDSLDADKITEFSNNCISAIESNKNGAISVPGNRPYREGGAIPLSVSVNSKCNECRACAKVCPVGAITSQNPNQTNESRCINCTACIYACPQKVRKFRGLKYWLGSKSFAKKCSVRLEPEFFIAE